MKNSLTLFFLCLSTLLVAQTFPESKYYFQGEVIVKIKADFKNKCNKSSIQIPSIQKIVNTESIKGTEKMFPNHSTPKNKKYQPELIDLSNIYKFTFDKNVHPRKILTQLRKNPVVEYAELNYINELTYTPSDTLNGSQTYLNSVKLFQAWDIQQGDTNVVIAITDTGTDLDHPDMINDYAYNYDDPINGIDDDNDGYIDNFNGWDVANNDNLPEALNSGHGINVAGIASASTDNTTGISGCGFNTRIMPIKIDDEITGQLTAAYQGIVYAADQGAFIISNSWGSHFYSAFSQDIVNYATLNKKCLVIAATGNDGEEDRFYPAAYENVLSVGSTLFNDSVRTNSNYGYWSDIFAPGQRMLTTNAIGGYGINGGTSMAAPVVAGIAGLVKSQFPSYTWEQVTEQLMNTGDDIYSINDPKYQDKLGAGRVNAFRAVSPTVSPGIVFINSVITDNNDDIFVPGDTISISGDFKNFLNNATNVNISLTTINNRLEVLNGNRSLGNINQLDSVSIDNNPFLLKINNGLELNETVEVAITITADNYSKKQFFPVVVNLSFITVTENNLTVSITSNGAIGYTGLNNTVGEGIRHLGGNSHLYDGSLMIGNSPNYVANKFRSESGTDEDFKAIEAVRPIFAKVADHESKAIFDDGNLSSPPLINVTAKTYLFKHGDASNSIIYEYAIENVSGTRLDNLHAGLILDWDIANFATNKIGYDATRKMGVSFSTDTSIFCGVQVLNDSLGSFHYALDNVTTPDSASININDGYTDAEKFESLSSFRNNAGNITPQGNDIVDVNSVGPFSLENGETEFVSFSITISDSLPSLEKEADSVQNLFNRLILGIQDAPEVQFSNNIKLAPNPTKESLTVKLRLRKSGLLKIKVHDINGKLVYEEEGSFSRGTREFTIDTDGWKTSVYFLEIRGDNLLFQDKFVVAQ